MTLSIFTAPEAVPYHKYMASKTLFLAGGITGCPDWQSEVIKYINDTTASPVCRTPYGVILNPRRNNFPIDDPTAAYEQIAWEIFAMEQADTICFWFPCETLCPIVLFEYGRQIGGDKKLIVGVHQDYARRKDVEIQTKLLRPDITVYTSFISFVHEVRRVFL